ncbi:MAG: porin [Bacteroidetes bacterium]|nr:porin [Bacteroidota bacterium]
MLRKLCLFALMLNASLVLFAQEDSTEKKSPFTFTGFVDGYFRSDLASNLANNRTSFTNSTGKLALGMISVRGDYSVGKFSFTADLGYGKRATEFAYNDKGALSYVKQLYASVAPTDWLKLTVGSWATHVGYELVDPYANRNYSMSYMFSYGPFLHTGIKADLTFGATGIMVGLANPTDYRKAPAPNKKSVLIQLSQAINDNVKLYLNYVGGQRPTDYAKTRQVDLVLTAKASDKFNVGVNGTVTSVRLPSGSSYLAAKTWSGLAGYFNYDPKETIGITLRSEVFNDANQLAALSSASKGASIFANTLSANIKLKKFTIIPEYRLETASAGVFYNKTGNGKKSASNFLIAAYFKL